MSEPSPPADRPIADYAAIGDTRSAALVNASGGIDWLCWPRFDGPAVFLRLLDRERGGDCTVAIEGLRRTRRRYVPGTNVLETTFETDGGTLELLDLMPLRGLPVPPGPPHPGPDNDAACRLLRRARCTEGTVRLAFEVRPTFDYARRASGPLAIPAGGREARFGEGEHGLAAHGSHPLLPGGAPGTARLPMELAAGEGGWLSLAPDRDAAAPDEAEVERWLADTLRYWEQWSGAVTYAGRWKRDVLRSGLVLKLLTFAPTGAIVAALTTSLPEAVGGDRNFDYRYTWLRDASFTVSAFLALGHRHEAAEFLRYLHELDGAAKRVLRPLYGVADAMPEEEEVLGHLSGWRDSAPVRIGNAAHGQEQLDIYGEFLNALCTYLEVVEHARRDEPGQLAAEAIRTLTGQVIERLDRPDHGVWESRGEPKQVLHSKGMLWLALDRAARIAELLGHPPGSDAAGWRRIAEGVRADYLDRGWNAGRGYYAQSYGSDILDASAMRLVFYGALPPDSPRMLATLDAVERDLAEGELVRRYRGMADEFRGEEGAFLACGFWLAACRAMGGQTRRAVEIYERLLRRGSDLGLFAEEMDPATGEHLGNYPQGFTHMAVVQAALRIEDCIASFGMR